MASATAVNLSDWKEDLHALLNFDLDGFPVDASGEYPISNPPDSLYSAVKWGSGVSGVFSRVRRQGTLITTHMPIMSQVGGGSRGSVKGFSMASRRRLFQSFSKVRVIDGHFWFVTLTFPDKNAPCFGKWAAPRIVPVPRPGVEIEGYGDDWRKYPVTVMKDEWRNPGIAEYRKNYGKSEFARADLDEGGVDLNAAERFKASKRVLKNFLDQMARKGFSGLWVLERTKRGIPHYHIILKHKDPYPLGDYFSFSTDFYEHKTDGNPWPGFMDYSRYWSMKRVPKADQKVYETRKAVPKMGGVPGLRLAIQKIWTGSINLGVKPKWLSGDQLAVFRKSFVAGTDVEELSDPSTIAGYFSKYFDKANRDNAKAYQKDGIQGRVWGVFGRADFFDTAEDYWVSNRLLPRLRELFGSLVLAVYGKEHKRDGYNKSYVALNNDLITKKWLLNNAMVVITSENNYIRDNCRNIICDSYKLKRGKKLAFIPELYRKHFPQIDLLTDPQAPF